MPSPWSWVQQKEHDFILVLLCWGVENVDKWNENNKAVVSWNSEYSSLHIYLIFNVNYACFHVDLRWALIVKLEEVKLESFGVMPTCEEINPKVLDSCLDDGEVIAAMLSFLIDLL